MRPPRSLALLVVILLSALSLPLVLCHALAAPTALASPVPVASKSDVPTGQPVSVAATAPGLIVVARQGVTTGPPSTGHSDFGAADPLSTPLLTPMLTLRNAGRKPITIERLQTSCGCTSALLGPEGAAFPKSLVPGEQADVRVTVSTGSLHGTIFKTVAVYARGSDAPAATLETHARLQNSVVPSATPLDFGRVSAGTTYSLPLTMTLDPRLLKPGGPANLFSFNPDVNVTQAAAAKMSSTSQVATSQMAARAVAHAYTVTLSPHAPIGRLYGTLSLPAMPSSSQACHAVFVTGEVFGKMSASPTTILFGLVPAGQTASRQVALFAGPALLAGAAVTSDSPWLSAHVSPSHSGSKVVLEVTFSPLPRLVG